MSSSPPAELRPESRLTDAELVAESLNGSDRAFRTLVQRYSGLVYNVVYRMTNNRELSEEMTQEAFLKVFQNLKRYDAARPFRPWLLRIASNTALSELRKQARRPAASLDELQEGGFSAEHRPEQVDRDEVATTVERSDASAHVLKALDRLDPRYKQALLLRYQHELSYEEVAEAMEIPLNTVRTWLRRGLEKLRHEVREVPL